MEVTPSKDDIAIFTNLFLKIETEVHKIAYKLFVYQGISRNGEGVSIEGFNFALHDKEMIVLKYFPPYV